MQITVITVGKVKEKYFTDAAHEYIKRLSKYCKLSLVEVSDEKTPDNLSEAQMIQVKDKEGDRILSKLKDSDFLITLEIDGKQVTSEAFAKSLEHLALTGKSSIVFAIGGSLGLSDSVKLRSQMALSFGMMTLPHQLMKVVLLEQVYRAFRIIKGEPYHK